MHFVAAGGAKSVDFGTQPSLGVQEMPDFIDLL
jgi:hypothetical protein